MSCIVKRKENGKIDRVFNPVAVSKNKPIVDNLTNSLKNLLGNNVVFSNDISEHKRGKALISRAGNVIGYTVGETTYMKKDSLFNSLSLGDVIGTDDRTPLTTYLSTHKFSNKNNNVNFSTVDAATGLNNLQINNSNTNFVEDEKTKYAKTSTGETILYKVFTPNDNGVRPDLLWEEGNKRESTDFALVERQFTEYNQLSFTAGTKIENANDVAWLFRSLEDEAIEHSFVVYRFEDGSYFTQHLGTGGISATVVDGRLITGNAVKLKAESVTFVHNHPSGALKTSNADTQVFKNIKKSLEGTGIVMGDGVIINLKTGKYVVFNEDSGIVNELTPQNQEQGKVNVYSFSKQVLAENYNPEKIRGSSDIAKYLTTKKFGVSNKTEMLITNNQLEIIGKFVLPEINQYQKIVELLTQYGGVSAILYGNKIDPKVINEYNTRLKAVGFSITDGIEVKSGNYKSLVDEGLIREEQEQYNKSQAGITKEEAIKRNNGNPLNLAPNGKPSILYQSYKDLGYTDVEAERLTAQVYSDNFKSWFGDWQNDPEYASKVVDDNGQPLLVGHGTKSNVFYEFKMGVGNSQGSYLRDDQEAYFFGNDMVYKNYGNGTEIYSFLNIKDPLTVDVDVEIRELTYDSSETELEDEGYPITRWKGEDEISFEDNTSAVAYFDDNADELYERAKEDNQDGILVNGVDGSLLQIAFSPNQIKSATENVGTFSEGSNDIRFQIIGEQGAANLDAQEEATTRLNNLQVAREMEQANKTPKEIRLGTGWERGADKKWRYEVEDIDFKKGSLDEFSNNLELSNKEVEFDNITYKKNTNGTYDLSLRKKGATKTSEFASFKNVSESDLSVVIDDKGIVDSILKNEGEESIIGADLADAKAISKDFNTFISGGELLSDVVTGAKELFTAYPQLKKAVVRLNPSMQAEGSYSVIAGQIVITLKSKSPNSARTTLLHEIQHAIQDIEGFAKGGNVKMFSDARDNIKRLFKDIESVFDKLGYEEWLLKGGRVDNTKDRNFNGMYSFAETQNKATRDKMIAKLDEANDVINENKVIFGNNNIYSNIKDGGLYKRLAGEVEARNVQERMNMTPAQRMETLLQETEYVAREDQIILMDSLGVSESRTQQTSQEIIQSLVDRLSMGGLSKSINLMNQEELQKVLADLGVDATLAKHVVKGISLNRDRNILFKDDNGNKIVFDNGTYRISIDDENNARTAILWHKETIKGKDYWAKRGTLYTSLSERRFQEEGNNDFQNYLQISSVEIEKEHRGKKLGLELYKTIIKYAGGDIKGLISHTPNRVNKREVPNIWDRLGGRKLKGNADYQIIDLSGFNKFHKTLSEKGITPTVAGFVNQKTGDVYIDKNNPNIANTLIHEHGHLLLSHLEANNPEMYEAATSLINGNKAEAQSYVDYVKSTQPNLEEGSKEFNEEVLAQVIGDNGARLLESKKQNSIKQWLQDFWNFIKDSLGLSNFTADQVRGMTLKEFGEAASVSILRGDFVGKNGEANFNKWKGDNRLVQGAEVQEVKTGEPIVVRGFHGTTNEFYEFDSSVKGNIEGHLGKVNYFTTDFQDASMNYQAAGADITGRIDIRQDELENNLRFNYTNTEEGLVFQEIIDDYNLTDEDIDNLYPSGKPEFVLEEEISRFLAEKELLGGTEQVLDLYIKLNNPVVLGKGSTWFETLNVSEGDLNIATEEIAEENDISIEEANEDYYFDIQQRAIENTGYENLHIEALQDALRDNGYDSNLASEILGDNFYETEIDLNAVEQRMRKVELLFENEDGEIAGSQVIADFFKNLGFDGIILTDVSQRFKNMGLGSFTSHVHVFDEFNNQIKLADGSNVTFGETSDIRFQNQAGITKEEAIKRNNGNPLTQAPNGKPSILYQSYKDLGYSDTEAERLTAQVYSNNFISWFGNWQNDPKNASKVVDDNGQPLVLYHGTVGTFTVFDTNPTNVKETKGGSFFGDKTIASYFDGGGSGSIMPVFLNSRNPYIDFDTPNQISATKGYWATDYFDKNLDDVYGSTGSEADGIYLKNKRDSSVFINVFNPNQIKSATENIGTFDTNNNDIRFQVISEKGAQKVEQYKNNPVSAEYVGEQYSTKTEKEDSELFNSIAENPLLTEDDALSVLAQTFTDSFKKKFGDWETDTTPSITKNESGEPKLFYRTSNGIYDNYKEALDSVNSGDIEIGYVTTDDVIEAETQEMFDISVSEFTKYKDKYSLSANNEFYTVGSLSSDSNPTTKEGFINYQIRKDYLSHKKAKIDGEYHLIGKGNSEIKQLLNARLIQADANTYLGYKSVKIGNRNQINIDFLNDEVILHNGVEYSKEELVEDVRKGNLQKVSEIVGDIASFLYSYFKSKMTNSVQTTNDIKNMQQSKDRIHLRLLQVLNDLGVSTTTITEYTKNYKVRNGVDLSVEAIADVANNVIAFADGSFNTENLTEETAHIIIEAYINQAEVESILPQVEKSSEWAQHSQKYYQKYAPLYKGLELERAVRREILGKMLANSILNSFNNSTEVSNTLLEILKKFINKVKAFLTNSHKTEVQDLIGRLTEMAINDNYRESLSKDILDSSNFILYSTSSNTSIDSTVQKITKSLEKRANQLKKNQETKFESSEIKRNVRQIERANNLIEASQYVVQTLTPSINRVKKAKELQEKDPKKGREGYFNEVIKTSLNYLKSDGLEIISGLKRHLKTSFPNSGDIAKIIKHLDEMAKDISDFSSGVDASPVTDYVMEEILKDANISENTKQELIDDVANREKDATNDVGWLMSFFGGLTHASTTALKALGSLIGKTYFQAEVNSIEAITPILNKWVKNGWNNSSIYKSLYKKDEDGKKTGDFISELDENKFRKNREDFIKDTFIDLLGGISEYERIESEKGRSPQVTDLSNENVAEYHSRLEKWKSENQVRAFKDEYYEKVVEMLNAANASQNLRERISAIKNRKAEISSRYAPREVKSISDLRELQDLNRLLKEIASETDAETGVRKSGQQLEDAIAMQEFNKLMYENYKNENSSKGLNDDFLEELNRIEEDPSKTPDEAREAAIEFFMSNAGISFSEDYWDKVTAQQTAESRIDEAINIIEKNISTESNQNKLDQLELDLLNLNRYKRAYLDLAKRRKQVLKQFAKRNNPAEVDTELMTNSVKNNLLSLDEKLSDATKSINTIIARNGGKLAPATMLSESTTNMAYKKDLEDSGMEEISFLKANMTDANKAKLDEFKSVMDDIKMGVTLSIKPLKKFLNFLETKGISGDDIVDQIKDMPDSNIYELITEYGHLRVASYYKRFAPKGYQELIDKLENSTSERVHHIVDDISNGKYPELSLKVEFEWLTNNQEESNINQEYVRLSKIYGNVIPNKEKYRDEEYHRTFNPNEDGIATTNKDKWEMLQDIYEMNKHSYNNYKIKGKSLTSAPKVSRQLYEKAAGIFNKGAKELIKEVYQDRKDEKIYGEELVDTDVRAIPVYFIDNLEDNDFITEDILFAFGKIISESNLHKERKKSISSVLSLQQNLLHKKFEGGKQGKDSNAYKMFTDYMDGYFYGVRHTKKLQLKVGGNTIDFTRLISTIDNFMRKMNIGFNPFIALSSAAVGSINLTIERLVGQDLHKDSMLFSKTEAVKLITQYAADTGGLMKDNPLNKMMETFGMKDLNDRISYTGSNRIVRASKDLPFMPISSAALNHQTGLLISILDDFRLVNGKFITFNQFRNSTSVDGLSKEEISTQWSQYRENSMYNKLDFSGARSTLSADVIAEIGQEEADTQMERVFNKVSEVNSNVDAILNKTDRPMATRNPIGNLAMAHSGWLTLNLQRKFKGKGINLRTGEMERGHYSSVVHYLKEMHKASKGNGFANYMQNMVSDLFSKESFSKLEDFDKRNINRTVYEYSIYLTMLTILALAMKDADDDDDEDDYAQQFMSFVALRTVSEFSSSIAPVNVYEALNKANSPFMAIGKIIQFSDELVDNGVVARGTYEGLSKFKRALIKMSWIKHYYDVKDSKAIRAKYDWYLQNNNKRLFMFDLLSEEEDNSEGYMIFDR